MERGLHLATVKKAQVQLGGTYVAKVSGTLTTIRITGESTYGRWDAVNTKTGRAIRIRSAARLRRPATAPAVTDQDVEAATAVCQKMLTGPARPVQEGPDQTQ